MEFMKHARLPWSVRQQIVHMAWAKRCMVCDERVGSHCRIYNVYELRSVTCVLGSSLRDLSSVSEEDYDGRVSRVGRF